MEDDDSITTSLRALKGNLPQPRSLTNLQKDEVLNRWGRATVQSILKAKTSFAVERIPFLFSSLDSQLVIDVLANDWQDAIQRWQAKKGKKSAK